MRLENDGIMTMGEVCGYLKISRNTADKLIKNGELKAFRVGRVYRILKSDVDSYIHNSQNNA